MWGEVLGLGFVVSLNPLLLGVILIVISRPRPVQNLLAFWAGAVLINVPSLLVPLMVMHAVPSFASLAQEFATPDPGSTVKPIQLGTGVLALMVAIFIMVRIWLRRRATQLVSESAGTGKAPGNASILVLESGTPTDASPSPGFVKTATGNIRRFIQRLFRSAHEAWENGSLWVSLIFGLGYFPPPPLVLMVDTIIVAEGASIGTQIIAVIAFVIAMLAVFEIALLSYAIAPARTEAVLEPLHEWSRVHRLHVLLVLFLAVGLWSVVVGMGLI